MNLQGMHRGFLQISAFHIIIMIILYNICHVRYIDDHYMALYNHDTTGCTIYTTRDIMRLWSIRDHLSP